MNDKKNTSEGKTLANDNVSNNAHYSKDGKITREDDRDRNKSMDDWNAEQNRSGRNK